jgi:hypothetical protein
MKNNTKLMIKILLFFVLPLIIGCEREGDLAVKNCFGESAEIIIEFEEDKTKILPAIKKRMKGNQLSLTLKYPEEKNIIRTAFGEIAKGSPIKKITIKRGDKRKVINYGDEIIGLMDTDMIGEIACCPFILCL